MIKNTYLDGEIHFIGGGDNKSWIAVKNNRKVLYCRECDEKDESVWNYGGQYESNLLYPIQKHNEEWFEELDEIMTYYDMVIDEAVLYQNSFCDILKSYNRSA